MYPIFGLPLEGLSSLMSLELLFACLMLLPTWVLFPSPSQLVFVDLFCILLVACLRYLHLTKVSLRCCSSPLRSSGVMHTYTWGKCTYNTVLGREIMVTILLQVLVSMSGLLVHCNIKRIVCFTLDQCIKKCDSPIILIAFESKLYCRIYAVYVIQK